MSFLTCFWLLPQNEHLSKSPPSPMRAMMPQGLLPMSTYRSCLPRVSQTLPVRSGPPRPLTPNSFLGIHSTYVLAVCMKHIARRRPSLVETRDTCLWRVAVVMPPTLAGQLCGPAPRQQPYSDPCCAVAEISAGAETEQRLN